MEGLWPEVFQGPGQTLAGLEKGVYDLVTWRNIHFGHARTVFWKRKGFVKSLVRVMHVFVAREASTMLTMGMNGALSELVESCLNGMAAPV